MAVQLLVVCWLSESLSVVLSDWFSSHLSINMHTAGGSVNSLPHTTYLATRSTFDSSFRYLVLPYSVPPDMAILSAALRPRYAKGKRPGEGESIDMNNLEQYIVKGTMQEMEKKYFRLTSAPAPHTVT